MSEVAVALDDGVRDGLQFVRLVPQVLGHHEQMSFMQVPCMMLNHAGAYMQTMNVPMVTKVSDGFLHPMYSRRLAVVSPLE